MKEHYYAFSFFDSGEKSLGWEYSNCYLGLSEQKVTLHDIASARNIARVGSKAVLISSSYMGFMTVEEFAGKTYKPDQNDPLENFGFPEQP